jgi:glutamyl-tRNA synthetase
MAKQPSQKRGRSVEENLKLFKEMQGATEVGLKNCLRFKLDYANDNGTLRDPVAFRCNLTPHLHTGTQYKARLTKFFLI